MADKPADKNAGGSKQSLDLNELSGLDFGPNWADERTGSGGRKPGGSRGNSGKAGGGDGGRRDSRGPSGGGASRDRRSGGGGFGGAAGSRGGRERGSGPRGARGGAGRHPAAGAQFEPAVKVDLYPQDEAFDALINRLRSSARTYQLFDIAQLLLEKPDRFVAVVAPLNQKEGKPASLYFSVPGHLPFESEEEAVNHVVAHHLEQFFDVEEIEVEPPKGNFQMVSRCTITGKLLGPPNYHRYQEFLRHHYATQISGMSFERFTSKIEGVKEPEQIEAWLDSMKKGARYSVKERKEGEPETFESLEAARHFLLQHRKDQVVGSGESVRFAGRDIERLPKGNIRRSVEAYIEKQKVFPLESANNIRGRLRRHKFAVYKKGSKGVSYVCAVKRKFRDSKTVFTESIRDLIDFIEKHPEMPASKLPKAYINIDTEKQKPEVLKMTESEVAAAAKAKAEAEAAAKIEAPAAETPAAETPTAEPPATETPAADAPATETVEPKAIDSESAPDAEGSSTPAADVKASTEAKPKIQLSETDEKALRQLMIDLRWLITEGYVTEYGDGRLFAPPPMPEAKPKPPEAKSKSAEEKTIVAPSEPATGDNAASVGASDLGVDSNPGKEPDTRDQADSGEKPESL
jgi:hypothetical protein